MSESTALDAQTTAAPPTPTPWVTVAGAARYAAVSTDLIYLACERNELRHVRIGGRRSIRVRMEWIDAWLERFGRGGEGRRQ